MTPALPSRPSPCGARLARGAFAAGWVTTLLWLLAVEPALGASTVKPRVVVETDAGGDPDDEQSLVRLLLYANDLDLEGILAVRARARDGENLNPERSGPGILRRFADAYASCWPSLYAHDPHYPRPDVLRGRMIDGTEASSAGVDLLLRAVDAPDPRPLWFCNWGSDAGSDTSNLRRALDRVLLERGPEGYARFKSRLRLCSADRFAPHTFAVAPAFTLWVDPYGPVIDGQPWYRRFSPLTATAGGFDLRLDVRLDHGPLGALYPTNTRPPQKEGDSLLMLYLVPNGLNEPEKPAWGGWGGRYAERGAPAPAGYFHASASDAWPSGPPNRDATLARWAEALQNDFRARLDWCVTAPNQANHPPEPVLRGPPRQTLRQGETITLDATPSRDPDGNELVWSWFWYPEATGYTAAPPSLTASGAEPSVKARLDQAPGQLHLIAAATDTGQPALTRYLRIIVDITDAAP